MQTTNLFYTLPQLDLCERLLGVVPAALTRSLLRLSGAEAMDGALKLAHRATGRTKFVSTTQSFHGRTLGALSIIGQEKHRAPYQRILQEGCFVPVRRSRRRARARSTRTPPPSWSSRCRAKAASTSRRPATWPGCAS